MGSIEIHRFAKGGTYSVPEGGDRAAFTVTAKRGDFFFRACRRLRTARFGLVMTDAPVVVPKRDYPQSVVRVVQELLAVSELPAEEEWRYREPPWSLDKFGASVESLPDGSLTLRGLRGRGHGNFVSSDTVLSVAADRVSEDLPRAILEAIGERPRDIPGLLGL